MVVQLEFIQYNTKFVKRHVAVASEALANRSVKKQRRGHIVWPPFEQYIVVVIIII